MYSEENKLQIRKLSEVELQEVTWLWYPYIPSGKITIIQAVLDLDDPQPDLGGLGTDAAYLAAGLTNIIDDRPVEDSTTKHYRPERKKRHGQTMGGM